MAKKKQATPKSQGGEIGGLQARKAKPKEPRSRRPRSQPKSQDTTKEMAIPAGIAAVMVVGPPVPIQTAQFSRFQITVTLTGKKNSVPQCDIRASLDDGPPSQSAGFGNAIKPLLQEVIHKLSLAYPGVATITLGVDGNGDLIPTVPAESARTLLERFSPGGEVSTIEFVRKRIVTNSELERFKIERTRVSFRSFADL